MWVYSIQTYYTNPVFYKHIEKPYFFAGYLCSRCIYRYRRSTSGRWTCKKNPEQTISQGRTVQCWLAEKKPLPAAIPPIGEIHRSRSNLQEPGCLLRLDLWKITLQVHFYKVPSTPLNTGNPGPEVGFRGCNHYIVYRWDRYNSWDAHPSSHLSVSENIWTCGTSLRQQFYWRIWWFNHVTFLFQHVGQKTS